MIIDTNERIIVVGHSLGSVIAYDTLTYLWQEMHSKTLQLSGMKPIITELNKVDKKDINNFSELSPLNTKPEPRDYLYTLRENYKFPWLITDLVTLGSPLTYADFLLADNPTKFEEAIKQREFPTCPPQDEDDRDDHYTNGDRGLLKRVTDKKNDFYIFHHAALFSCTRWINLYFPGDKIGGPIARLFGSGVQDVEVSASYKDQLRSHVNYWNKEEKPVIEELYKALNLEDN